MSTEAYDATLRLGTVLSVFAAVCAVVLTLVGDVSTGSYVVSVLLVGSIASWVQSGHEVRAARHPAEPALGEHDPYWFN